MKKGCLGLVVILGVIVLAAVILISYGISFKNSAVKMGEGIDGQWAQIDNQLLRRAELIPDIVKAVSAYAKHEKEVFTNLNNARNQLLAANTVAQKAQAEGVFEGALNRLMAVAEAYPELKASEQFTNFEVVKEGTENRLATERMRYNELVRDFNTKIKQFPGSMLAGIFGIKEREYFEIPAVARANPDVNFD